jgi:N-acetyl-beta-hexosaminidase
MNIAFFKRFIRDFVAAYKFNTLIMELNAGTRLETHPELNAGWRELVEDTNYSRRNYPPGALHNREQNSSHQDTADGGFLEKRQVAEIADWVRAHDIELIPEMPSFTHSYYLLSQHKDLSEVPGDKWPDTYCPSDPRTYDLLFEVYDEYIELLKPKMVHVGHDELFAPIGLCPRCKDKDIGERYGEDVARIHEHLQKKNIQMAICDR